MSVRDKLNEAEFFLVKFTNAKSSSEQRYYFSAFISAWRSITFSLQKQYTTRYAPHFGEWYGEERKRLRAIEGAGNLLKVRDVVIHEGNKYPEAIVSIESDSGDKLEIYWDMSKCKKGIKSYKITFPPSTKFTFPFPITVTKENEVESVIKTIPNVLLEIPPLFENVKQPNYLYTLGDGLKPMSMDELVHICRINLDAVKSTVDEAEVRFVK